MKKGTKNMSNILQKFQKRFGEGTAFDLDYGKLMILGLLIYIAFFKEWPLFVTLMLPTEAFILSIELLLLKFIRTYYDILWSTHRFFNKKRFITCEMMSIQRGFR